MKHIFTLFLTLSCLSISVGQNNSKLGFMVSGGISHVSSLSNQSSIEFDNAPWINAGASLTYQLGLDEIQIGFSYNVYNRDVVDFGPQFGCDLQPNGQVDKKNSSIYSSQDRQFIGVPINYVIDLGNKDQKLGLVVGVEPRFMINQEGLFGVRECGIELGTQMPIELVVESTKTLFFTKLGIQYKMPVGQKLDIVFIPLIEIMLNEEDTNASPTTTFLNTQNRLINIGLSIGIKF